MKPEEILSSYIPIDRRLALHQQDALPNRQNGAILFADISGFTPLSEALALALGPQRGAEELTRTLNEVYDALITEVHRFGGSVNSFSGDAITCWFPADEGLRATTCALNMQEQMAQFASMEIMANRPPVSLGLKVSVATGSVRRFVLGSPDIQLIDAIAGSPLDLVAQVEKLAERGDVVVSEQVAHQYATNFSVSEWREYSGVRGAVVTALTKAATETLWPTKDNSLEAATLQKWLIKPVYQQILQGDASFLADIRPVTTLFLSFTGLDYDNDLQIESKLKRYIRWVQTVLDQYGGYFLQVTFGDKGSYLYATFGAPIAHHDDMVRAVGAAMILRRPPEQFSFIDAVHIGISQGRARTGAYGGPQRQTYGVLGSEINIAARLMQRATAGEVYVRQHVAEAVATIYQAENLGEVAVKGVKEPIGVFRITERATMASQRPIDLFHQPLFGRDDQQMAVHQTIERLAKNQGRLLHLTGVTGIGKSHLAAEIAELAQQKGAQIVMGVCQSASFTVPYEIWGQILRPLLGIVVTDDPAEQASRLQAQLAFLDPSWGERAPLIADVLGINMNETATTAVMEPKLRQESLIALVIDLLRRLSADQPLVLLFEDMHWADDASRPLLTALSRAIATMPVLLLVTQRPVDSAMSWANNPQADEYVLTEIDQSAVAELADHLLEGHVASLIVSVVQQQAQGNPFFVTELLNIFRQSDFLIFNEETGWDLPAESINALKRAKQVVEQDGELVLIDNANLDALRLNLPDSVYTTVLGRLDRLPESHKLTLKVASVIGRIFQLDLLTMAHPAEQHQASLFQEASELMQWEFVTPDANEQDDISYLFKHNTVRDVAYDSLLSVQRKQLHLSVAKALQKAISRSAAEIAYHAYAAEAWETALTYHVEAGRKAEQLYANADAIDHLLQALDCAARLGEEQSDRVAQIDLSLGELFVTSGQYDVARTHLLKLVEGEDGVAPFDLRARAYHWMTRSYELGGDYEAALQWIDQGQQFLAGKVHPEAAQLLLINGLILARQGKPAESSAVAQEAQKQAEQLQDRNVLGRVLTLRGHVARMGGQSDGAIKLLNQALDQYRQAQNLHGEAIVHNQLGNSFFSLSKWGEANYHWRSAHVIFNQMGDLYNRAIADNNLGQLALYRRNYDQAADSFEQALQTLTQIGQSLYVLAVLNMNLGAALTQQNQFEEATHHLQLAQQHFNTVQAREFLPELRRHEATLGLVSGQLEQAAEQVATGLNFAKEMGMQSEIGILLRVSGEVAIAQENHGAAVAPLRESIDILTETGDTYEHAVSCSKLAISLRHLGEMAEAEQLSQSADLVFDQLSLD